jgi:predicted 3-demethylubiquinone-9 3-methyltransferase (glyoxalase superfamily)
MKKLIPFLWFDGQAEEAVKHYTSIFKDSKMGSISRYGEAGPGKPGNVLTASFEIMGLEFVAFSHLLRSELGCSVGFAGCRAPSG